MQLWYRHVRRIVEEHLPLKPECEELARWAHTNLGVKVLFVSYEVLNQGTLPYVEVILDRSADMQKLRGSDLYGWDKAIRQRLGEALGDIVEHMCLSGYEKMRQAPAFVSYGVFGPEVILDAMRQIPDAEMKAFKQRWADEGLWTAMKMESEIILFYHTDEQISAHRDKGLSARLLADLIEMARPYDPLGYIETEPLPVVFDSKQNFDENFSGQWHYYFK